MVNNHRLPLYKEIVVVEGSFGIALEYLLMVK